MLAMCIHGGHAAVAQAASLLQPHMFASKVHQDIFKNLCILWDENQQIDWRSVSMGLDETPYRDVFREEKSPKRYVSDLSTAYPYDATMLPKCVEKIVEFAERRAVSSLARKLFTEAMNMERPLLEIKGAAVEELLRLANDNHQLSATAGAVLASGLEEEIIAFLEDPTLIHGVRTGVNLFDKTLGGLEKSRVITILADTSIGKSFFTHWLSRQVARLGGSPLIFSTEMPKWEVVQRLAYMEGQVDRLEIRHKGVATNQEKGDMRYGMEVLKYSKIAVSYAASMDIKVMATEIRRRQMTSGVDCVFVDHIQGMRAEGIPMSKERELINAVTSGLKTIAGELDIPIVAISHIHRPGDETSMARPTIRQAHGSGSIERDSDSIISLYPVSITTRADGSWLPSDFADRLGFLNQQKTGKVAMEIMIQKSRAGGSARDIYWLDYSKGGIWIPLDGRKWQ